LAGLETLFADAGSEWKLMALPGMSADNEFLMSVIKSFAERLRIGLGQSTSRLVVDLEGGVEAYLGRRSRNFRRALRRGEKKAKEAGIAVVDASTASATELFARIQAVEKRGWKGRDEVGITEGAMHDFYQRMMPRLCLRGAQRVLFAQHEEQDIAYIFGGLRMGGYRGLQFSYDEDYREYGLGNLLQIEQIRRLCAEGALTYDLGMHMDYKLRWADREYQTLTLLLIR
jgi:CelD/BcsL family acetyltransferase involved in cellulose biosynthesis